ncbi:MAG TPA: VWA domain-containing protein [Thermomonas sp.]|nr:VWA domain-containing protein [Thermomonas sp.]
MSGVLSTLAQLHFLRPWWLLVLACVAGLLWWQRSRMRQKNVWRDAVDAHLLPHLLEAGHHPSKSAWHGRWGACALVLAVLALAGPSLRKDVRPLWQARMPLVIALDLSSASMATDLPPNRLAQARARIANLLHARAGGQVALVVFAEDAYTVAPLTADAANLALFLDALSPDVMPEDGQRPDRAIRWSQQLLQQAGFSRGDILLLTDHARPDDLNAASLARTAGYRVSVLGLGSAQGGVFQSGNGLQRARLDADSLRALASRGGGEYVRLTTDDADLRSLGVLTATGKALATAQGSTVASWRDDGYWLLPIVLLLCLPLFRRGGILVLLLACGVYLPLLSTPAYAQTDVLGKGSLWQRADQMAHARMLQGIAAYDKNDYAQAIATLSTLPSADAQYNLGNALARAGRYDDAIAAYNRALQQQPYMADAQFNKRVVEQAKREQQQQKSRSQDGKQSPRSQGAQQANSQNKPQDSQQGNTQQQQAQNQNVAQGQPQSPKQDGSRQNASQQNASQQNATSRHQSNTQRSPQPQDAQAQQQANTAQQQRMQQALRDTQNPQRDAAAKLPRKLRVGQPPETSAQREQRLADQAALQRVPDDPGALLRARFQLEAQRRRGDGP